MLALGRGGHWCQLKDTFSYYVFTYLWSSIRCGMLHNIKLPIRKGRYLQSNINRVSDPNGFKVIVKCNIKDFVSGELRSEFGSCDKCSILLA